MLGQTLTLLSASPARSHTPQTSASSARLRRAPILVGGLICGACAGWTGPQVASALALAASSYILLGINEWMGLRWAGVRARYPRAAGASFIAYAFAHMLGFYMLTASAARVRLYRVWKLSLTQVGQVSLYCATGFGLGAAALLGWVFATAPAPSLEPLRLPLAAVRAAGAGRIAAPLLYVVAAGRLRASMAIFGRRISAPAPGAAGLQVALGAADVLATAALIFVLLPARSVAWPATRQGAPSSSSLLQIG